MSLIASYILPHCPIAIPDIARGQERFVSKTREAFIEVAKEIAALHPDTIVISSPHAESYRDYFQMADGETATGSLKEYGAPQIHFRLHYDTILRNEITRIAANRKFPAGFEGAEDPALDHGTMVPLYFINNEHQNYKVVCLGVSGLSLLSHYKMGQIIADASKNVNERVVFIASGNMSHCLKKDGVFGYSPEGERYEELLNNALSKANFGSLLTVDRHLLRCAKECGHRAFCLLAGTLDRKSVEVSSYSHESPFGIGYGTYGYRVLGDDASRAFGDLYVSKALFSISEKRANADEYLKIAYEALDQYLNHAQKREMKVSRLLIEKKSGIAVSIYEFGVLRARFVTLEGVENNIAQEIIQNTIKAAKDDAHFDEIRPEEWPYLDVHVSEIGPLECISSSAELDLKKYGVLIKSGSKSGYALPDFTYRNTEEQLLAAKKNALIKENERAILYRFPLINHG